MTTAYISEGFVSISIVNFYLKNSDLILREGWKSGEMD